LNQRFISEPDFRQERGYLISLFVYIFAENAGETSPDVPFPDVSLVLLPLRPESDCDRKAFRVGCLLTLPPADIESGLSVLRCAGETMLGCLQQIMCCLVLICLAMLSLVMSARVTIVWTDYLSWQQGLALHLLHPHQSWMPPLLFWQLPCPQSWRHCQDFWRILLLPLAGLDPPKAQSCRERAEHSTCTFTGQSKLLHRAICSAELFSCLKCR